MLKVELKKIIVNFDTEDTDITDEEGVNITVGLSHLEMGEKPLTLSDKPRIRQSINDELDRLNKGGFITDKVANNITYTFTGKKFDYIVETKVTLSKVDTVTACSEREALELVEDSDDTHLYLDDLKKSNDFSGVEFTVIDKE